MASSPSVSAATAGRCAATVGGAPGDPQLDPVVELEAGFPTQVLDGPGDLAGITFRAQLRGQLRVEDHDEAVILGHGRARPGCRLDLDLVGSEGHPGERDRAIVRDLDGALSGGGHDRRDSRAKALADLWEQWLHATLDELGSIGDELDRPAR